MRHFIRLYSLARLLLLAALPGVLAPSSLPAQRIHVDHRSVALFDHIPQHYIEAAAQLRMLFMDRSVGGNIDQSLGCLSHPHAGAPNYCKRHQHRDSAYAVDPGEVYWNGTWDRSRWRYEFWPGGCSEDADCFIAAIEPRIDSFDVVGFQHSYLAVTPGSNINHPVDGYFGSRGDRGAVRYAAFEARHPGKTVIWWTSSLARGIGTPESETFNIAMRDYTRAHGLVLFDVADILSHNPAGEPCFDNRDGVAYLDENHPDDGLDIPAICPQYTTETEGGHLGSISAGGIRVAKAFWVLMARIAGWDGSTSSSTDARNVVLPAGIVLSVAPNPLRDHATVSFPVTETGFVRLEVLDVLGRSLHVIDASERPAGPHRATFRRPHFLRRGQIYFLRMSTGGEVATTPVLVE